ncbi:MAG: hypothetical protein KGP27_04875 [Hyphomicrobiales bacterium]|nr:hypothetical protein [Hyphomicrobiales bacterium]
MKILDPLLVAATLALVPALAWLFGRFAGRRNWPVTGTIVLGIAAAVLAALAKHTVISMAEVPAADVDVVLARRLAEIAAAPEFYAFLMVLGAFMSMLAWSATPVAPGISEQQQ